MIPLSGTIFHLAAGSLLINFWRDVFGTCPDGEKCCEGNGLALGSLMLVQCILMLIETGLQAHKMVESGHFRKPQNAIKLLQLVSEVRMKSKLTLGNISSSLSCLPQYVFALHMLLIVMQWLAEQLHSHILSSLGTSLASPSKF